MKNLKKIIPLCLLPVLMVALTGCGKEGVDEKMNNEKNPIATMIVEYVDKDGEKQEGTIKMELYKNESPETVKNFVNLANNGFYNGLTFHRIVKDFMIQGGDKAGNGTGSASASDIDKSVEKDSDKDYPYTIKGEFEENNVDNGLKFEAGTLAMARSDYSQLGLNEEGYNSASSQFFIMNTDDDETCGYLQGLYAIFGKVIEGYDVVQAISEIEVKSSEGSGEKSEPINAPVIKKMEIETYGEKFDLPKLINADETMKKVQETYMKILQQYYSENADE